MLKLLCALSLIVLPAVATADDTLRFYLDKSDLVFVAEALESDSHATGQWTIDETGVVNHGPIRFKVAQSIKGGLKVGHTEEIQIDTPDQDGDRMIVVKRGEKYILFVNAQGAGSLADLWFGIQRHSPGMVKSLVHELERSPRARVSN